jgi:hypothetical protein
MEPYSEYNPDQVDSDISWDSWIVGGRYGGLLKLRCSGADEKYKWNYYIDTPRGGRLFRCEFLEILLRTFRDRKAPITGFYSFNGIEDDFFIHSGMRDGYIYVDGCKISDLYNYEDVIDRVYGFSDDMFGKQSTRDHWDREIHFVDNQEYENELKAAFERNKYGYLTILDLHN